MKIRTLLVDSPTSLGAATRARRWQMLQEVFPDLASYRVLDLGGTAESWLRAPVQPKSVTILNLTSSELNGTRDRASLPTWITPVEGDACAPPPEIDAGYDLVYSNSLIEHVGGPRPRAMLAEVAHRYGRRHWIQTPYRYFPIEPHWIFPGFQFLPLAARAWISTQWPLMHTRSSDWTSAVTAALGAELLSITEMRHIFPNSVLYKERVAGLTKSLVAIRT